MTQTATENCKNVQAHQEATCYCYEGVVLLAYKGKYYSYQEFDEAFPRSTEVKTMANYKGENSDRTKGWISNQKSY